MTVLSVNINRIALLRNSRDIGLPNLVQMAKLAVEAGASGITMHPRPDERHIRSSDVFEVAAAVSVPITLEGRPTESFITLIEQSRPAAVLFVPDAPEVKTSDRGWDLEREAFLLPPYIARARAAGARVNLFMDPDPMMLEGIEALEVDGIEIYTGDFARAFGTASERSAFEVCRATAAAAQRRSLNVNAGHDLNLDNLSQLLTIPGIVECSIGHALTAEALIHGWQATIRKYLAIMRQSAEPLPT
jgi:pyridoxine 5-phosphate synthase